MLTERIGKRKKKKKKEGNNWGVLYEKEAVSEVLGILVENWLDGRRSVVVIQIKK